MSALEDMVGARVGHWVVLGRAPNGKGATARWYCRCGLCGRRLVVYGSNLRQGRSRVCRECFLTRRRATTPS